jgi:hypothetical protein
VTAILTLLEEVKQLTAPVGAPDDNFGNAVRVSGDTAIVGALLEDSQKGAVYVFERDQNGPDNWGPVKRLVASDGEQGSAFGSSVGIEGDTVVVGAASIFSGPGAVYVFERNQGGTDNWGEVTKLVPSESTPGDLFGSSVGINGNTITVGAPGAEATRGVSYVFERDNGVPAGWSEVSKLTALNSQIGDGFGISVGIAGDTVAVGADKQDGNRGAVYIFERNAGGPGAWGQHKKLTATDGVQGDNFGSAIDIDQDTLVAGAPLDDVAKGSAYVFARNSGGLDNWAQVVKLTASDPSDNENFGNSVGVSGDTVVVGAGGDNAERGACYAFERNAGGTEKWGEVAKLTASDGVGADQLGFSIGIDASTVVSGAIGNNLSQGSAYVFALSVSPPPTPTPTPTPTPAPPTPAQAIQNLVVTIETMALPNGVGNSLTAHLNDINPDKFPAACGKLNAFTNEVNAKTKSKQLTLVQATQLLAAAAAIKSSLGCSP